MANSAYSVTKAVCPAGEAMLARSLMIRAVVARNPSMITR